MISGKYPDLVTKNFLDPYPQTFSVRRGGDEIQENREPGYVYEKYNVVAGTIYDAEYPSRSFHGWSYGVFIWCLNYAGAIK